MNDSHLYYLHRSIHDLMIHESNSLTLPTLFEYYCALQLSIQYDKPFTVWKDISPLSKSNYDMHLTLQDKGVDCASSDFKQLVQVKHYGETTSICRGTLSTFLSFRHFLHPTKRDGIKLLLARTGHSKLTEEIRRVVEWGDITDHTYDHNVFLEECQQIKNNFIEVKMKQEARPPLRPPQLEALKVIEQSDSEEMNCILSIPTGVGKTRIVLEYCRLSDCSILVFVPTLVLMDQWYNEAVLYGFDKKKVVRIGSSSRDGYDPKSTYSLVICVYNSVEKLKGKIDAFKKIVIDEAHRIKRPHIYKDDDITIEEDNEDSETESEEEESDEDEDVDKEEKHLVVLKRMICSRTNILLMSATIDGIQGYLYYSYTIREAIERGDICDYQLRVPIYNNCPNDLNIAEYLIREAGCHCIVFCSSIKQSDEFSNVLNSLLPNSARSVHSQLVDSKRKLYIQEFEASQIRFLVNVEVLVEGFNCPIVSSCVFLHLSSSETFAIQAIGRCLRMYPGKEFANIFLPYNRDEDLIDVKRFITEIGKKDPAIRHACMDKVGGTYINLEIQREVNITEDDVKEEDKMEVDSVVEFRFEAIFNSLGQMDGRGVERWKQRFQKVIEFESIHHYLPSLRSKVKEEKQLGKWICTQQTNFKKRRETMKVDELYLIWNDFRIKFNLSLSQEDLWKQRYQKIIDFEYNHKRLPLQSNAKDIIEKKLGTWIGTQQKNFIKRSQSMKNDELYMIWNDFRNNRFNLLPQEEFWKRMYMKVIEFEQIHHRLPTQGSNDIEEKRLGKWIDAQQTNFNKKRQPMKIFDLYLIWKDFRIKFNLLSLEDLWKQTFQKIIEFESIYHRLPTQGSNDIEEKQLGSWVNNQQVNFRKKSNSMKNEELYLIWDDFRIKFNLLSLEDLWKQQYQKILDFESIHHRLPNQWYQWSRSNDIEEKRFGLWVRQQQVNFKKKKNSMKIEELYMIWNDFRIKFNLLSQEDLWKQQYQKILDFESIHHRLPYEKSKDVEEKQLGSWIAAQQANFKKKNYSMKINELYMIWKDFRIKFNLLSREDLWRQQYQKIIDFESIYRRLPSRHSKDDNERQLGNWIQQQQRNFKKKTQALSIEELYLLWAEFRIKYNKN